MSLIIPANSLAVGGYNIDNSLRFDDGSSDYLNRTPSSASNRKTWTFSTWFKRSNLGVRLVFLSGKDGSFPEGLNINTSNQFEYDHDIAGTDYTLTSNMLFRDVSAWYNLVVTKDTTQATETDRLKVWVNGTQITLNEVDLGYPPQNYDGAINKNVDHFIGNLSSTDTYYFDGYMAETYLIDGQALSPTDFGEFDQDTGIWKPIKYTGTYGTNGFYLDFENSGSLGADQSGNGNNFTVNNLTSIDQVTDTPTNNFSTMSPLIPQYTDGSGVTYSQGNLNINYGGTYGYSFGGFQVSQGKWYWEGKVISISGSYNGTGFGFQDMENLYNPSSPYPSNNIYVYGNNGDTRDPTSGASTYGNSYTTNDIIGIAMDLDNGYGYFSKNGVWQNSGVPTSGASGTGSAFPLNPSASGQFFAPYCADDSSGTSSVQFAMNFGNPTFTIASGNSDANGYGNFEYSVPSGYYSLCTKNLAEFG